MLYRSELKLGCYAAESVIKIHVAVDECDFRIYCGVLEIQNRKRYVITPSFRIGKVATWCY